MIEVLGCRRLIHYSQFSLSSDSLKDTQYLCRQKHKNWPEVLEFAGVALSYGIDMFTKYSFHYSVIEREQGPPKPRVRQITIIHQPGTQPQLPGEGK